MKRILLKQKNKEMYSVEFEILENDSVIGQVFIKGKLGSMDAIVNGTFHNKNFSLKFANKVLPGSNKKFRPYNIIENKNITGEIFQTIFKKNFFSKYEYIKCNYNEEEFKLYSIGFGDKQVCVIYKNDVQISQIEFSNVIYNDLHDYIIYIKDDDNTFISILLTYYLYVIGKFKPGVKVPKSVVKYYQKDSNKDLISKYDPDWISKGGLNE